MSLFDPKYGGWPPMPEVLTKLADVESANAPYTAASDGLSELAAMRDEAVDAELRSLGLDPVALGKQGAAFVELLRERARLKELLHRDATGLGEALTTISSIAAGYNWITTGEWGSYDYAQHSEETLRAEMTNLLASVNYVVRAALTRSGQRADAAFGLRPPPVETPIVPRTDSELLAENARLRSQLASVAERLGAMAKEFT